jgi:hypothetical protein
MSDKRSAKRRGRALIIRLIRAIGGEISFFFLVAAQSR